MNEIYLDHNATTPLAPEVAEAMVACQRAAMGNPASQHRAGRRARQLLEEAREGIAAMLGADLQSAEPDRLDLHQRRDGGQQPGAVRPVRLDAGAADYLRDRASQRRRSRRRVDSSRLGAGASAGDRRRGRRPGSVSRRASNCRRRSTLAACLWWSASCSATTKPACCSRCRTSRASSLRSAARDCTPTPCRWRASCPSIFAAWASMP